MDKILLKIVSISYSQNQSRAYVLLLAEVKGNRSLPIIIGSYEAQAIILQIENMRTNRPLTHDLFVSFAKSFDIYVKEVVITEMNEGVFHAQLLCERDGQVQIIDARTSDAIAIALRFGCPIYAKKEILDAAGIENLSEHEDEDESENENQTPTKEESSTPASKNNFSQYSMEQLQDMLNQAIDEEDYESASKIRDEINKRTQN